MRRHGPTFNLVSLAIAGCFIGVPMGALVVTLFLAGVPWAWALAPIWAPLVVIIGLLAISFMVALLMSALGVLSRDDDQ